ncbi:hypothetical protein [Halobacteriovorax sp. JY17]|uniref:hypothetical protein n=1 Tax=Halobacteriovorax sp. JY17 TaxID=2014617 RepID=UPI000C65A5F2|nr:hypothetical protein [Halobacteriovorax sp. JY17]PIK16253.1 MAG: hypothetical protein CES88_05820 [Halobacteriovorax sp. JY17]
MKKLIVILGLTLMTSVASASVYKVCVAQAQEACKESQDFNYCFDYVLADCIDYNNGYSKSVPACEKYCSTLPEATQRAICLQTCSPL